MELFEIIIDAFFDGLIVLAVLLIFVLVLYFTLKIFYKNSNRSKERIIINNDEEKDDVFGLNELKDEKKFKEDIEDIKKSIDKGDEQIKVEFTKAMYILKNFSRYNFFSTEDNRIVFEKLKQTIDQEVEIENIKIDENVEEKISHDTDSKVTVKKLEDGKFKVCNSSGYYIMKGRVIIESVNYAQQEREKEEDKRKKKKTVKEKVDEIMSSETFEKVVAVEDISTIEKKIEEAKANSNKNSNKSKEESIDEISEKLNSLVETDIASLEDFENFDFSTDKQKDDKLSQKKEKDNGESKSEESQEEKEVKGENKNKSQNNEGTEAVEKDEEIVIKRHEKYDELKHDFPLIEEEGNIVFILTSFFDDFRGDRIKKFLNWILSPKFLFDELGGYLFVDIDLKERTLFVDAYLFIYLLSKFYSNPKSIYESMLYSDEILNYENIKKIISKVNHLVEEIYQDEFFKLAGRSKSPVKQRLITYNVNRKVYASSQMLMIKLDIQNEDFKNSIDEIKNQILSKYEPKIYKASIKDNKSQVVNISNIYFTKKSF